MHFSLNCFLLGIVELSNNDAYLEVFSREKGRVSVLCKGFQNSKKRRPVLDYFRVLNLEVVRKYDRFILTDCGVVESFEERCLADYNWSKIVYSFLKIIKTVFPPEKIHAEYFAFLRSFFANFSLAHKAFSIFVFLTKTLFISGFFPSFREEKPVFFDFEKGRFLFEKSSDNFFEVSVGDQKLINYFVKTDCKNVFREDFFDSVSDLESWILVLKRILKQTSH